MILLSIIILESQNVTQDKHQIQYYKFQKIQNANLKIMTIQNAKIKNQNDNLKSQISKHSNPNLKS